VNGVYALKFGPMKPTYLLPVVLAVSLIAGCQTTHSSKSGSAASSVLPSGAGFDTAQLVTAFKNADTETTRLVQEAVTSLGKKDWSGALTHLQKIQEIPGLTAAQADSVKSLISGLNTKSK